MMNYETVMTKDALHEVHKSLLRSAKRADAFVAFDIETTGLDPRATGAKITSISLTTNDEDTWVIPLAHPDGPWGYKWQSVMGVVAHMLRNHDRLVAHNAGFEIKWIWHHTGFDLTRNVWADTMTMAHLINENRSKRLKDQAAHLMGGDWGIDVRDTMSTPWFDLARYNADDTIATARLFKEQAEHLAASDDAFTSLAFTVHGAQRVLMRAEHRGILLDRERAAGALLRAEQEVEEAAQWLMRRAREYGMAPDDYPMVSWEATAKWFLAFTEQAVKQGHLRIDAMTPAGRPSWAANVLTRLSREGSEVAERLLTYRHGSKQAQFIRSWQENADDEGRVHASFNVARTSTGRLSSSNPNMQQVSRELKHLFRAPEGGWFCEADYSQIEMRVAAQFVHDTVKPDNPMMEAYRRGTDLHSVAATLVTGGRVEDVTKEERQAGKAINFGFIFGMGASKFVDYAEDTYGVTFTLDEAKRLRDGFFDTWEGLGEWHEYQRQFVRDNGYVRNLFGRYRRLPDVYSTNQMKAGAAERQAINSPVQGSASDMMLRTLVSINAAKHRLNLTDLHIVGTVHDSVLLEAGSAEAVLVSLSQMTNVYPFDLPIEVDVSLGTRWGYYTEEHTLRSAT